MRRNSETDAGVTPEDRHLIDVIAQGLRPSPMDGARRALFRQRLEARLERRTFAPWKGGLVLAVTAVAAATLWIVVPETPQPVSTDLTDRPEPTAEVAEPPILYAFVAPQSYGEAGEEKDYLPDDYFVLASLLEVGTI